MKVKLIVIGGKEDAWLKNGYGIYEGRLDHYLNFETIVIPSSKTGNRNKEVTMTDEAREIGKRISPDDYLILLDNAGKEFTSGDFAVQMQKLLNLPGKKLVFLLGGAFGFAPEIYQRANYRLSLSKFTFNHQLARLVFLEQLYRAMTILKGEKYHH